VFLARGTISAITSQRVRCGARINFEYFLSATCEAEISFRDTHTNSLLTPFINLSLLQALDQIDGQTSPGAVVPTAMS
jgi:hypothetical protein